MITKRKQHNGHVAELVENSEDVQKFLNDTYVTGKKRAKRSKTELEPYAVAALGGAGEQSDRVVAEIVSSALVIEAQGFLVEAVKSAFAPKLVFDEEVTPDELKATIAMMKDWADDMAGQFKTNIMKAAANATGDNLRERGVPTDVLVDAVTGDKPDLSDLAGVLKAIHEALDS